MFLGTLRVWGRFKQDVIRFLEQLLDTNASRVQGDVEQRVVESRLRLEAEVRKLLREVSRSAEQALSQARELLAAGSEVIPKEVERLRNLEEELKALRSLQSTGGQDQSSEKA